jgi:glycosyltransferase involved in cell wall biosynthesis
MKQKTDTLVILTPAFPENEAATYWVPSQQLFVLAVKRNFPELNVIVLSFQYPEHELEYTWNGISIASFNGMKKRKLKRLQLFNSVWRKLKTIQKSQPIMGILSFWCSECALIGKYFGKRYNIRHFCWLCGQDARQGNKLIKFIRPKSNELIAMSNFLANEFDRNYGIKPAYTVFNGIDRDLFPALRPVERNIDLLAAGSLSSLKQYEIFVETAHRLKEHFPGLRARHCGEGSERNSINAMIEKLDLRNNLSLLGEKKHEEVLELMQQAKIFLHPSSYEGFGVVCLEALYAGAHVISFCDPTGIKTKQWHIVHDKEEMFLKAYELLSDQDTVYQSVETYKMDDAAKAIMQLYGFVN